MKGASAFDPALATRVLAGPGADVAEGVLREIQDLSDHSEYAAAAARAAGALRDGGTDVRAIAPFLLGVFLDKGPPGLPAVLGVLTAALTARWAAVRPEARKERVVDSALSWLFRSLVVQVDFHEKMMDETFRAWAAGDAATVGGPSLEASGALRAAIEAVVDKPRSTVQLSEVEVRIRAQWNRAGAPPPARVAPPETAPDEEAETAMEEEGGRGEPEEQEEHDEHEDEERAAERAPAPVARRAVAPAAEPPVVGPTIEISPAMHLFLRKLAAFDALVARGELARAAVVAEDVRAAVESFDPRVYFPKVLSPYFRVLATHVDELAPYWDGMDTPSWKVLDQLYRVDLDAFLAE